MLFTGNYLQGKRDQMQNIFLNMLTLDNSVGDNTFFQVHRNESRTTLIAKGLGDEWTRAFGEKGIHRRRIVKGKDLNAVNLLIEAMLLEPFDLKGLVVADFRQLTDRLAVEYLLHTL